MKGFTLIELLIVLVLIGVISSMTLLAMSSGDQRDWRKQEAERLLELFQLASQEAMVRGNPIAIELFSNGYRFMIAERQTWQTDFHDDIFRARTLHPNVRLNLQLEQKNVPLNDGKYRAGTPKPQIVFTPDGEISRFQLNVRLTGSEELISVVNTLKEGLVITTSDVKQP